jgi:hypothetical protein
MKTLADIKRRATAGTRLEVIGQTRRPDLVGTVRTIVEGSAHRSAPGSVSRQCYDFTSSHTGEERYCTPWPKAANVRILDADTFEYDLRHPARGNTVRLRFVPGAG